MKAKATTKPHQHMRTWLEEVNVTDIIKRTLQGRACGVHGIRKRHSKESARPGIKRGDLKGRVSMGGKGWKGKRRKAVRPRMVRNSGTNGCVACAMRGHTSCDPEEQGAARAERGAQRHGYAIKSNLSTALSSVSTLGMRYFCFSRKRTSVSSFPCVFHLPTA